MTPTPPEAIEAALAFVQDLAQSRHARVLGGIQVEARRIAALLPKPVDPLLLEARRIVKETLDPGSHARCNCRDEIDAGGWDKGQKVRIALAALRAGAASTKGRG